MLNPYKSSINNISAYIDLQSKEKALTVKLKQINSWKYRATPHIKVTNADECNQLSISGDAVSEPIKSDKMHGCNKRKKRAGANLKQDAKTLAARG